MVEFVGTTSRGCPVRGQAQEPASTCDCTRRGEPRVRLCNAVGEYKIRPYMGNCRI
jgi:hypothetical protein